MTGISNDAKKADIDGFCEAVKNFSSSVNGLTEAAAQVSSIYSTFYFFFFFFFFPPWQISEIIQGEKIYMQNSTEQFAERDLYIIHFIYIHNWQVFFFSSNFG